ncbi:uncharacterized protein LOC108098068 [Drosophila ficusphila]|uniref:uncharacterized protein LOC108098068 n=1 Tax=Drosophila ficusphila TaxID=30025 RepID=UPI0007E71A78|nr:uncharacterized protein LOC108098068 [Drosophila ficusphila]
MWKLYSVSLCLSVLCGIVQDVLGSCELTIDSSSPPLIVNRFGTKTMLSQSSGVITREYRESIELLCGGGVDYIDHKNYDRTTKTGNGEILTFHCGRDGYFKDPVETYNLQDLNVVCHEGTYQLFESNSSLPNCEGDMTLVLGHDLKELGSKNIAALCYDIVASRLKYIAYTTSSASNLVLGAEVGQLNDVELDTTVNYRKTTFKPVRQTDIDAYVANVDQLAGLFQSASLVQDNVMKPMVTGYEDMMTTTWLRSLRSGNWRHWIAAMRLAARRGLHFDVRLGASGELQLPPFIGRGPMLIPLVGSVGGDAVRVPAHIWAHVHALEPTGGVQDEFVIIGYNSPFVRNGSQSDLCISMCDQVSWLQQDTPFGSLREFPTLGLVHCCRVEDVAAKLDHFPGPYAKGKKNLADARGAEPQGRESVASTTDHSFDWIVS